MGKCSLGVVDRGASVKGVDDIVTDRLRVVTDNVKAFAQVQVLDHIINDKGLGSESNGREQSCLRSEHKE